MARVVLTGLAALLKQAQQLPGFGDLNPDTFVNLLDKFQEVGSLAYTAVSNAPKLAATFVNGAWGGLKSFLDNIPDRLKTVFFQWLSSGLTADGQTVPELPTKWDDLPSIGTFALELMGLGSDDLLGLMVELDLPDFGRQAVGWDLGETECHGDQRQDSEKRSAQGGKAAAESKRPQGSQTEKAGAEAEEGSREGPASVGGSGGSEEEGDLGLWLWDGHE